MMKTRLSKIFSILVLCHAAIQSPASHLLGFHLTAQYAGIAGTYNIKGYLYRDCSGTSAPASIQLQYRTAAFNDSINLLITSSSVHQFSTSCIINAPLNCASGSGGYGVEKVTYEAQLTLPFPDSAWILSIGDCCFYSIVLASPGQSICSQATLNTVVAPADNLPEFVSPPDFLFCINSTVNYTQTAADLDGDSIVYALIPVGCSNVPATYNLPYSGVNFVASSTPVSFNSATGTCSFTPTTLMYTYMNVRATEYRNGTAIGTVERISTVITTNSGIPSGLNETIRNPTLTIIPNPVKHLLHIQAYLLTNATLIIHDITGRILIQQHFDEYATLNTEALTAGIYSISLFNEKKIFSIKFIKE